MKNFRLRYRILGGHVHVRVFSSRASHMTHSKLGDLVFDLDEWPLFVGCLNPHGNVNVEVVPEDEPLPSGEPVP